MFTKLEERSTELSHLRFQGLRLLRDPFLCPLDNPPTITEDDIIFHFEVLNWDTARLLKGALDVLLIVSCKLLYEVKENETLGFMPCW